MAFGSFVPILHAHLPYVLHHGSWPHGSDWVCEAVAECYIPIINVCNELIDEGILPKLTIDISPILCEQLEAPYFKALFQKYCQDKIDSAKRDEIFFKNNNYDPHQIYLAEWWGEWYAARKYDFLEKYSTSIIGALKKLQDQGAIEIMTCGLTHGYYALLGDDRCLNLQTKAAVENYKKYFDREPRGIWVPECSYRPSYDWKSLIPIKPYNEERLRPGVEQILDKYGLKYFVVDEKLTRNARALGKFINCDKNKFMSVNQKDFPFEDYNFDKTPLNLFWTASSEETQYGSAIAFTRHENIAMSVWSGDTGYPGEPDYLDFHKKRMESLLRYWRVTDNKADMMYKTLYHPDWVWKKLDLHSHNFIENVQNTLGWYNHVSGKSGTVCAPFDMELFGHWWFEGPEFLRLILKGINASPYVNTLTASEEILRRNPSEVMALPEGSWGANSNHEVWMNDKTKWMWEGIYNDEKRMREIEDKYWSGEKNNQLLKRVLLQAMKEMTLLEASDWPFLITTKGAIDYAEHRFSSHRSDYNLLLDFAEKLINSENYGEKELLHLEVCEKRDDVFPELHLEWRL